MVTESTRKPKKRGVAIRVAHGPAVMTEADVAAVEDLLARLVVRKLVAEHPEWFGRHAHRGDDGEKSGPPGAAAAVASAPLAKPGGPAEMELEHDRTRSEGTH